MIRMTVVNAKQGEVIFNGIKFGSQIILWRNFKPALSVFCDFVQYRFSLVNNPDTSFRSIQKPTAFVRIVFHAMVFNDVKGLLRNCNRTQILFQSGFSNIVATIHINQGLKSSRMTSLYRSPLSGKMVTITPSSICLATLIAPARLAAEDGLSKSPSLRAVSSMRSMASPESIEIV